MCDNNKRNLERLFVVLSRCFLNQSFLRVGFFGGDVDGNIFTGIIVEIFEVIFFVEIIKVIAVATITITITNTNTSERGVLKSTKERLTKDVRYQEFREITLGCYSD